MLQQAEPTTNTSAIPASALTSIARSPPSPNSGLTRAHHMWALPTASTGFSSLAFLNSDSVDINDAAGIEGFI
jgi:hypothetical protein